jgi:hypothetical protein
VTILAGQPLLPLELPSAPPVTTAAPSALRHPKAPAIVLLLLGLLMTFGPIAGGLFAKTASGQQMIQQFAPHMRASTLNRYGDDIRILYNAAMRVDTVFGDQHIPAGRFTGLDEFRQDSTAVIGRASDLLSRIRTTAPSYRRVAAIGGFNRIPFLIVAAGIVAIYGACVLLTGRRNRSRFAVALVVLASAAIGTYPFVSNLSSGAQAGQTMLRSLTSVMTPHEVRLLQGDFIVLVNADGELETSFRGVPQPGPSATAIITLVNDWPKISSDFASLVGVIDDNIANFNALDSLDSATRDVGLPGLSAFPWLLVALGSITAGLAVAALPRRRKET